jgi:LysR family hydrogen peroxide-inducible transcriptional activator
MPASPLLLIGSDITLRQLQYLSAVAAEQNLSAAARRCHVSQPALAEQLEKLEKRVGKLLVRGRRLTTLTPLGAQVLEKSAVILAAVADIERLARYPNALRIGMIDTVAPYMMADLMSSRSERILPVQAQTHVLIEMLVDGKIDAAVLAEGTVPPGFATIDLGADDLYAAVAVKDETFAKVKRNGAITVDDLDDHEMLLLADGHCLRTQVIDVCRGSRTTLGPLEAATLELLAEMVVRGLGVTLVPAIAKPYLSRNEGLRILRLDPAPQRKLQLVSVQPADAKLRSVAETLAAQLN